MKYAWEKLQTAEQQSAMAAWRKANDTNARGYTASVANELIDWAEALIAARDYQPSPASEPRGYMNASR